MATILFWISIVSFSLTRSQNTTQNINYCVEPLVASLHNNPIHSYGGPFSECALSCNSGKQIYGLTSSQQAAVDSVTIIGTILCLIGLIILSINLYLDTKISKEKFTEKPLLSHIPYIITISTFLITLLMSMSLIFGKESVVCFENKEFSLWNPGEGKQISCTIFSIFFYTSLLYYELYVLLLSFAVWRQFKNPLNPLWKIRNRYWHLAIFIIVLSLNIIGLATSSVDAIEPMGVCMPGPATKSSLFAFVIFPMLFSCVLSGIFLVWSSILVKSNIDRHKKTVSKNATMNMIDLFKRILVYGFGVLFTLTLLVSTAFTFYIKHDVIREGLKIWIQCELKNNIFGSNIDCRSLRKDNERISSFWFMSWIISCLMAIIAQVVLSFHTKARKRAAILKQKTLGRLTAAVSGSVLDSPKSQSKNSKNSKNSRSSQQHLKKIKLNDNGDFGIDDRESPRTVTTTQMSSVIASSGSDNNLSTPIPTEHQVLEIKEKQRSTTNDNLIITTPQSIEQTTSE